MLISRDVSTALCRASGSVTAQDLRWWRSISPGAPAPSADASAAAIASRRFRRLRALAERHGLPELSMGMSGDFEVAIEEGATMVRVGTAIFGPRG
jgi:hypothetical protein